MGSIATKLDLSVLATLLKDSKRLAWPILMLENT